MPATATTHRFDFPADYVDGDPAEPQPLTGGTLTLAPGGILFDCEGSGFAAELDELEGITVTGSRVRRPGFEATTRGYTKVALVRDGHPIVWEFSIDRSAGTELRDMLHRVFEASGREPLPYVEELTGFGERASTQATGEMPALTPEAVARDRAQRRAAQGSRPRRAGARPGRTKGRVARPSGDPPRSDGRPHPARSRRLTVKQRRLVFGAIGAMVLLEITIPLLFLKVL